MISLFTKRGDAFSTLFTLLFNLRCAAGKDRARATSPLDLSPPYRRGGPFDDTSGHQQFGGGQGDSAKSSGEGSKASFQPFSGDLNSGSHSSQNNQGKSGKFDNSGGSGGSTNHGFGDDGSSGGFGHSANSDHKSDNDDDKPNAIAEDPFQSEGETASVLTSGASSSSVVQGTNTATGSQSNPSSISTANTTSTSQTSATSQRASSTSSTLMANPSSNVNPQTTTPGDSSISPFLTSSSDGNVPSSSNAVNASPLLSHSNAGAIAGGAVGGFVLISTLLFMLIFCLKWRKKRRTPPSAEFVANTREVTSPSFIQIERSNNESDDSLPPFANAGFKDPLYEKIGLSRDLSVAYGLAV